MNIGVILRYGFRPETGGGFSYYEVMINSLMQYRFSHDVKIMFFSPGGKRIASNKDIISLNIVKDKGWLGCKLASNGKYVKLCFHIVSRFFPETYVRVFKKHDVRLLYYINQDDFILSHIPYVMTVWDMGFRVTYPFPELIRGRNFNGRNTFLADTLQRALLVFSESEAGKEDLVKYANVHEGKIRVLPIFAGEVINEQVDEPAMAAILKETNLIKDKFFFYPAQFWAHKNHVTILKAFCEVSKSHPDFRMVFTGGDKSNLGYVKQFCARLGLEDKVYFLGYVSKRCLYTLYKNASALVMASFFGETNMPPLEAMGIGCPVICSDIAGHREIMGDAAIYFSAWDSNSLTSALLSVVGEEGINREKVKLRMNESKFRLSNTLLLLDTYLYEACQIRDTWE